MKIYVISKNGIPVIGYTSLLAASGYLGIPYAEARGMLLSGNRIVVGGMRLTSVKVEKIRGRGKKF